MDFSNVQPGVIPSSAFDPPSSCANACPAPPPPPSGSCPNSPAPGCGCVPSSASLSFCTGVDYPLPEAIIQTSPSSQDSFVEQAYNMMVAVMPSPSSACTTALKNYLCAFYFPECTTDGITFLPCGDLCPTAACGSAPTTCPNVTGACTDYGH